MKKHRCFRVRDGCLDIDVPLLLQELSIPDTPHNRDNAVAQLLILCQKMQPGSTISALWDDPQDLLDFIKTYPELGIKAKIFHRRRGKS